MTLIIGISGTHGVGKTTLINTVNDKNILQNYHFSSGNTRWIQSLGFKINEDGDDTTQKFIAMKMLYDISIHDNLVTDRTTIDCYVYTKYLYDKGKITLKTIEEMKILLNRTINRYDYIFYIRPEFEMEDDGIRSINQEFKDSIHHIFEKTLDEYSIPFILLTGSKEKRLNTFVSTISNYTSS